MKMVSLEQSAEEAKEDCSPCEGDAPKYPWGTVLHLDEHALKRLGVKEMPAVGTVVPVTAIAVVTGTSEREHQGGKHQTLDLQITKMAFGEDEAPDTPLRRAAKKLYG